MLSIILPVHNEEQNLKPLHTELESTLIKLGEEFEIIYVDDGSKDNSYTILKEIVQACGEKVKVIRLARNYGQTLAISAGIEHSKGDILILMDADFQNDPKDIPKLVQKLGEGYDIVSGWRKKRKDSLFTRKIPSYFGNRLISLITGIKLHDIGCTLKAYRRQTISNIKLYGEMHRILPVYAGMRGASIAEVEVSHNPRVKGKSNYGLSRIFKLVFDLITVRFFEGYLTKPIYFFGGMGIILFLIGFLIGFFVVIRKIFFGGIWISPLLFISIMFFTMGLQFVLMGLLAEMTTRLYYKSQIESPYLIREIIEDKEALKDE